MSAQWEAYGSIAFPSAARLAEWKSASVDDASTKAVAKLARGTGSDEAIGAIFAAYEGSTDRVECIERGARVDVCFSFDGSLLLEHGATIFGALARAGAFGGEGVIYVEDAMHPTYILTVGKRVKLAKWDKKTNAPPALVAAHRERMGSE